MHIIQKNQLTTAKTTHILHQRENSQKSKPVQRRTKNRKKIPQKTKIIQILGKRIHNHWSLREPCGARFVYVPFWPDCRAVRADRLGYVQTGNCWIGQLLHMRKLIVHSMLDERQRETPAVSARCDNADVGVWRTTIMAVTPGGHRVGKNMFYQIKQFFRCFKQKKRFRTRNI